MDPPNQGPVVWTVEPRRAFNSGDCRTVPSSISNAQLSYEISQRPSNRGHEAKNKVTKEGVGMFNTCRRWPRRAEQGN